MRDQVSGYTSRNPATMRSVRTGTAVRRKSHPWKPVTSAAMLATAIRVVAAIAPQSALASALNDPVRSNPEPCGSSTKMKGTRNAGVVYFQHCRVVLYGSPPVMAAAAKGESAVGGDTSESTA